MTARPLRKVLLVDDDPAVRRIAETSLRVVGRLQVVAIASGLDLLETARVEQPDAIILDVMMPEMDGPACLFALRGEPTLAPIPVLFMTARAHASEVERYLALGVRGVITKPFDPMTLPETLRRMLGEAA